MGGEFVKPDGSNTDTTLASIEAAAFRLGRAMVFGLERSPELFGKKGLELLSIHNLWTTAIILIMWVAGSVIGGPIGLAVNGVLIALALYHLGDVVKDLGEKLSDGLVLAWNAENDHDIEVAGMFFAEAFSTIGIELVQLVVTHRLFLAAKPRLLKRFKLPSKLEAEHKAAKARAEKRLADEAAEKRTTAAERAKQALVSAAELAAAGGVQPAAKMLPTAEIVLGVVAGVAVVGGAVAVLSATERKGRRDS